MLENVWVEMSDADITTASLWKYKFTWDRFELNSYNSMWCYLTFQAMFQMMKDVVHYFCRPIEEGVMGGDIAEFEPFLEIITAVNRLVDIMNGMWIKNGNDKEVFLIVGSENT